MRPLRPRAFALLPALAFTFQEHLERWLHSGTLPLQTVLEPTFFPGLLLQLPIGLVAYVVARFLLRAAEQVGCELARSRPPRRVAVPLLVAPGREPEPARRAAIASSQAKRGPPSFAAVV